MSTIKIGNTIVETGVPARLPALYTAGDLQRVFGMDTAELCFAMRRGDLSKPSRRDAFGLPLWDRAAIDALAKARQS